MKKLCLLLCLAAASTFAQTATTTTSTTAPGITPGAAGLAPNAPFSAPAGLPGSPVNPGLPAGPVNAGLPGFTNILGPFLTNGTGLNLSTDLAPLLLNLEASLAQALPALASFNNNFDVVGNGTTLGGTNGSNSSSSGVGGAALAPGGNNFSTLSSSSAATSFGANLGQNLSTIVGGAPRSGGASSTTTGPNGTVTTATTGALTGGTNAIAGTGFLAGFFGTNNVGFVNSRDAFRALIVLQADVERMLPLVAALNGVAPGAVSTSTTTNGVPTTWPFGTTSRNGAAGQSTVRGGAASGGLLPTGR